MQMLSQRQSDEISEFRILWSPKYNLIEKDKANDKKIVATEM